MVGGHGTAGAFGPVLEDFDVKGATTICTAAATFGLIAGSLIGGPIGKRLIDRKKLLDTAVAEDDSILVEDENKHERHTNMYAAAVFQLIIAVGIGTIISELLTKTGLTFPIYIGAMIAAAVIRNIGEYSGKFDIYMCEINNLGGIWLSLFLAHTHDIVHIFCCVQRDGQGLRCGGSVRRNMRIRYGSNAKCHGEHAGYMRPLRSFGQGVSDNPTYRKFIC